MAKPSNSTIMGGRGREGGKEGGREGGREGGKEGRRREGGRYKDVQSHAFPKTTTKLELLFQVAKPHVDRSHFKPITDTNYYKHAYMFAQ